MKLMLITAVAALTSSSALAQHIKVEYDGFLDKTYPPALAVQDTQTQFGDANLGLVDLANGSEIDEVRAFLHHGVLQLFICGNLESNLTKLEVFVDFRRGGQNQLRGDNADVDSNGLNRMGDDGSGNGLRFDEGFEADHYFTFACGGRPFATSAWAADLLTDGGGLGQFLGNGGTVEDLLFGANGSIFALDNSNTVGVTAGSGRASGAGAETGIEIAFPLIGLEGFEKSASVLVCIFVNSPGHDFVSNQVLAGLGGSRNLGDPRGVDFSTIRGPQYITVIPPPEPGPADFNGDEEVNAADLAILLGSWGFPDADLNEDGTTDALDLAILLGAWTGG